MYIIGDVHGCFKTLLALVDQFPTDEKIFFTGDLIDRGPCSKEVVQWVIDNSDRCKSVSGNHEQMLLDAKEFPRMSSISDWYHNGGGTTLKSYIPDIKFKDHLIPTDDEIEKEEEIRKARRKILIPQEHLDFFKNLPIAIVEEGVFVSHSCWNGSTPIDYLTDKNNRSSYSGLTWYRGEPQKLPDGLYHVFGHTPIATPDITDYYANIDTGCVFTNWEYGGNLTAIHYPTLKVYQQKNLDIF